MAANPCRGHGDDGLVLIRHHFIGNYKRMGGDYLDGTGWDGCLGALLFTFFIIPDSLSTCLINVHAEQGWNTTLDSPRLRLFS